MSEHGKQYLIRRTENRVELWSKKRLPFEPTGWLRTMRDELKDTLKTVRSIDDPILHAFYSSSKKNKFDVENVLFYNIGASSYKHLCERGISFERRFISPPESNTATHNMEHYQCYCFGDNARNPESYWREDRTVAIWRSILCPPLRGDLKPHNFWYELKRGQIETSSLVSNAIYYGIKITVSPPLNERANLASAIKSFLDGIISAFHQHNGVKIMEVSSRLAKIINVEPIEIQELLLDSSTNVLGCINLLFPYRNEVKWNPADDKVVKAEIFIGNPNISGIWTHSGKLFSVIKS